MADITAPADASSVPSSSVPAATSTTPSPAPVTAPTPTTANAVSEYLTGTTQQVRGNLAFAVGANPDYESEMAQLARQTGLPIDSVRANPLPARQAVTAQSTDYASLVKQFPATAAFFKDPNNAKTAHDDVHNLATVEGSASSSGALGGFGSALLGGINNSFNEIDRAGTNALAFVLHGVRPDLSTPGFIQSHLNAINTDESQNATPADAPFVNKLAYGAGGLAGNIGLIALTGGGAALPEGAGLLTRLAFAARGMTAPSLVAGINSAQNAYNQTGDPSAAIKAGAAAYVATTGTGLVPLGMPGGLAVRAATGAASGVFTGEAGRLLQNIASPASMQQPFDLDNLGVSAFLGAMMGSVLGPRAQQAEQATSAAQAMSGLSQAAAASKLRPRDPQAFKDFVTAANDGAPVQNLYVDADQLVNALNQHGISGDELAAKLPDVAEQLPVASDTGGQVRISVPDFATHLSGDIGDTLLPHMRIDPDAMTFAEANEFRQNAVDEFAKTAEDIGTAKANDDAVAQSAQAVHDDVLKQLTQANRFRSDVNNDYALLAREFYTAQAARAGVSPEEMYQRYPLRITADDVPGANALNQEPPEEPLPLVAKLHGEEIAPKDADLKTLRAEAVKHYNKHFLTSEEKEGLTVTAPKIGDVTFLKRGRGKMKTESANPVKLRVMAALPELIENGRYMGSVANTDLATVRNIPRYHFIEGAVDLDGKPVHVRVNVEEHADGKHYYNHTLPGNQFFQTKLGRGQADPIASPGESRAADRSAPHDDALPGFSDRPLESNLAHDNLNIQIVDQDARGKLSFSDDPTSAPSVITLHKNADLSTFEHELGHFQLEMLSHMARQPDAPPEVVQDMKTLTDWFGTTPEAWRGMTIDQKRPMHEQFARGFEAYLFEGNAPSAALRDVFRRVRAWMISVYRSLQNLNVELSPEVRAVFDRLLATNDAIRSAEAERGYQAMFTTPEEANMTPDEFAQYHALGHEATLEASDELSARTLRDLRFAENLKLRALREVRQDVGAKRRAVHEEVSADVAKEPVYRAENFIRRGELDDDKRSNAQRKILDGVAGSSTKLSLPALKEMYGDDANAPWRYLDTGTHGLAATDGVHPDLAAELFGFNSGDQLVRALLAAEPQKDVVEAMTDQRMLERYGDITSPQAMSNAANEAIHNQVRTRFIATELKALAKATGPVRALENAAKEVAQKTVAGQRVGDISAPKYGAAERRAGRAAIAAQRKGDLAEAAQQKRNQLLNNQLEKTARNASTEVLKALDYLKRFNKTNARQKIDSDILEQIDDMLARFDLRKNPTDAPTRAQVNLAKWVDSQVAIGMAPTVSPEIMNPAYRTPYRDMTLESFRGLTDAVKSLEKIGRDRKTITINGEKVEIAQYVAERLVPKMEARGGHFTDDQIYDKPADRTEGFFRLALDNITAQLRSIRAQLKPQEYKRNQYDMHELLGPFGESIYEPVFRANYREVDMLKGMSDDFQAMADQLGRKWQDSLRDQVTNTRLMDVNKSADDAPVPLRITRGKMIGIALHVGNESNFDKLTSGWKWNASDVWTFLHDNMGANDWKAVQSVWDQYDKHWPDVEAMSKRLGNTAPDRIEPRAFQTKFGEQRGGYAAIRYDPLRSRRGEKDAQGRAIDPSQGLFGSSYYRADTTTNGSLNARNAGYSDVVDLDFHTIAQTMHETLHDLAYRETLIDVNKLISNPTFRKTFQKTYGPEAYRSLQDWLGKLANQDNQDRDIGALGRVLQYTRTGMVINGIAFRVSTVLKHGGSAAIKTTGYFAGGGEKFLASRFAAIGTNYTAEITGAQAKFPEIRARLLQQDRDFRAMSASLFEPESKMAKAERFGHAAVAWSDMMTAVPTAWAAYDWAITKGIPEKMGGTGKPMTEEQAVAFANKIVREAHGSNITSARSMVINSNSEAVKMFTTLYGFMNNTYGQTADIADKLRTAGISNPQTLARAFMALIVPAIWAAYLTDGSPADDKHGWAAWVGKAISAEVAGTVPFVRDAASMVEGFSHAGQVGIESWMNTIVKAGVDTAHAVTGHAGNAPIIKDVANAVGMGLHIPGLGQLGGSAQYVADVSTGKQHPSGPIEFAKGVLLGKGPTKH